MENRKQLESCSLITELGGGRAQLFPLSSEQKAEKEKKKTKVENQKRKQKWKKENNRKVVL